MYSPESSGKTMLTLQVITEAQKAGDTCAVVDAEHALDPIYTEKLGVNVDDIIISQLDTGERVLAVADMLIRSGAVDLIVVDSVAALTREAEIEVGMGGHRVGWQTKLMPRALRSIIGDIKGANCLAIFINQIRIKIGPMFGNPLSAIEKLYTPPQTLVNIDLQPANDDLYSSHVASQQPN